MIRQWRFYELTDDIVASAEDFSTYICEYLGNYKSEEMSV